NVGKSTLFNALTGSNQYVGNWPGVTVEKKSGKMKKYKDVEIVDLPGIYSLSPYTMEEVVSRNFLVEERPDVILNIVDGTNLERNLYLTTQLMELGIPVVIAINMIDVVRKNGGKIDIQALSKALSCPAFEISALKSEGIDEAVEAAVLASKEKNIVHMHIFSGEVEHAIAHIEEAAVHHLPDERQRWYAVKIFERDEKVISQLNLDQKILDHVEKDILHVETVLEDDAESIIANDRYVFITGITSKIMKKRNPKKLSVSDQVDRIVTNRILAIPFFAAVMFLMYAIAMGSFPFSIGTIGTNWANDVFFGDWIPSFFDRVLTGLGVSPWLYGLVMDGILAGVGSVLGFVPQILVLSLLLSLLEDIGYMSRVAFIMDRILRKFGLSGKSIIPMIIATGCGVPGILASRTVEQENDRKITVMTTGFIPCGAKMPIIGLFAGAVFGNSPLVAVSAFFIGVMAVVISGVILKKFKTFAGKPAPFVMELPSYHLPSAKNVLRTTMDRGWDFVKRATTIVLLSSIVLWFFKTYGFVDGAFAVVEDSNQSVLAYIGKFFAWIFYPIGWVGDMAWKATVATATGLIAKEEVVMTFGTLYNFGGELSESGNEIWAKIAADFGAVRAYSFMIFNLLCAPCFAAIGAIRREMGNVKWTLGTVFYMCSFAYVISMIVYQIFGLFTGEAVFGIFTIVAFLLVALLLFLIFRKGYTPEKTNKK
ncbi:MAG: ferrous iron transport protein B, partial [Clostridia bacterium]|nr:ferrous iron transport protein B [Clostridia bacterium]